MSKRKYTDEEFVDAVNGSYSIAQALSKLGLKAAGGNYRLFKYRAKEIGVDCSHFTGQGHLRGKKHNWSKKRPLGEILTVGTEYSTDKLRKRLLDEGIFERRCNKCGNTEWMSSPIPLELEHKNGIVTDNRLENLEILCPNCHALTPTYRGKNIGRVPEYGIRRALKKPRTRNSARGSNPLPATKEPVKCSECGIGISKRSKSGMCFNCYPKSTRRVERPSIEKLRVEVEKDGYCAIARRYGVSDNAIRKWLR